MSWFLNAREGVVEVGGRTHEADHARSWLRILRDFSDPTKGLLGELEGLADGRLPTQSLRHASNPGVKIRPGPDLPERIRLAHAVQEFRLQTDDDTPVTRQDVDDWIDVPLVEAHQMLELRLRSQITDVARQLEYSLRREAFETALEHFTPMQFMRCVVDVVPVLAQTGELANAVRTSKLFTDDRLTQVFDLLQLHEVAEGESATEVFTMRHAADGSVLWGSTKITDADQAKELAADVVAPKKLLETYKLYREHIIPAIMVSHLERGTDLATFTEAVGGLVKRSTLPFFPDGALDADLPSLAEFKAQVEQADTGDRSRWRTFDSALATELDRAAAATGSVLGVIDLYLAVEKVVSAPQLTATDLKDLVAAGLGFVDDGLSRMVPASTALSAELGAATKGLSTAFCQKIVSRTLFVFALYDAAVQAKAVSSSTSTAEVVGKSLTLAGSVIGVGASGIGLLAQAGIVSVGAAPVVVAGLVAAALGLIGWAVIALFHQSYPEQILRGCYFRKDPDDRQTALAADKEAVDLRTGFVEQVGGTVQENLKLQIAYAVGLTRGFGPSAEDRTGFVDGLRGKREVRYSISRTPNSDSPPSSDADMAFAAWVSVYNLDFDEHGNATSGSREQDLKEALFEDFENPVTLGTLDDKKPPLELEIRTSFRDEPLTFEPLHRGMLRWMAENVVAAGGQAPTWQPGAPERLQIRERVKAE
ncbi:hypothetical protein PU560_13525 [Georgenia sp. 10Sc9-8]|uniref:Uncharacterized protein n=1 Tax=Georgenia halotolerans TaxID=3028317 RepID=A0ABT5U233_9MICO|nr:hypothetical protein [Georgenia halotolerans]